MDSETFNKAEKTIEAINAGLKAYDEKKANGNVDKLGLGFNQDSRFSTVKFVDLSLDSWSGTYGHSGCSTFFYVGDKDCFREEFIRVLNINIISLLRQVVGNLEVATKKARQEKITQLEEEIRKLRAIDKE